MFFDANLASALDRRLVVFQTGDFLKAARGFDAGARETYREQRRSVEFIREIGRLMPLTVVSSARQAYDQVLDGRIRCVGIAIPDFFDPALGTWVMEELRPELLICRLPHVPVLRAAAARSIPTLASLADTFAWPSGRDLLRRAGWSRIKFNAQIGRVLRAPNVTAVANHSLVASRSLHTVLRYPADRIVPREWTPMTPHPRAPRADGQQFRLVFAGATSFAKGIDVLLDAAALLGSSGVDYRLDIFGDCAVERAWWEARARPLAPRVVMHGSQPNEVVMHAMARAEATIVPTRKSYAEGLPNVVYEALAYGAPLVVSDHPAMAERLHHMVDAIITPQGDPAALAQALSRLAADRALRARLSAASAKALAGLYFGTDWYSIVRAFLGDPTDKTGWVAHMSYAAHLSRAPKTAQRPEAGNALELA